MPVDKETWTGEDWAIVTVKWFFACVGLLPTVSFFVMLSYVTCKAAIVLICRQIASHES